MSSIKKRVMLRNGLMVILVINFLALASALTTFSDDNPFKEYRIELVVSFILIAALARQVCKNCKDKD